MSIIISDVSYRHPNRDFLFEHLNFAVAKQRKVAIVGDNGTGKTPLQGYKTLLPTGKTPVQGCKRTVNSEQ